MSATVLVEFDDAAEHNIPPQLTLLDDKGQMKSQVLASEVLFANFDTDDELTSKRGAKELVLGGVNNTGAVSGGRLVLAADRSYGQYQITDIVDDFGVRFAAYYNRTVIPGTPTQMAYLQSNVDSSRIEWRYQNQGGGIMRIYCKVLDSSGSTIADFSMGTQTAALDLLTNVAVSNDDDGNLLMFLNGALVNTIVSPAFDFTDCTLRLGNDGTTNAAASFDNVQVFNAHVMTSGYAFPFPEPTTYVLTEHVMETYIPFVVDEIISLAIVHQIPTGAALKFGFDLNGVKYAHDGSNWAPVDLVQPLLAQANTEAELIANLSTLPIVKGIGKTVKIWSVFQSTSGYATGLIESLTMKYKRTLKPGAITSCNVKFRVVDNEGEPIEGATIRVQSKDKFMNNNLIGPSAKATTDTDGQTTMSIPETETDGTSVNITTEYIEKQLVDGVETDVLIEKVYKKRIIPNAAEAEFEDLNILA